MKIEEFTQKCEQNGYICMQGEHEGKEGYFVSSEKFGTKAHFANDAIENHGWPMLNKNIIQGKDVSHMTRVVGYYSKVQNWNKSKCAELNDRSEGDYKL